MNVIDVSVNGLLPWPAITVMLIQNPLSVPAQNHLARLRRAVNVYVLMMCVLMCGHAYKSISEEVFSSRTVTKEVQHSQKKSPRLRL